MGNLNAGTKELGTKGAKSTKNKMHSVHSYKKGEQDPTTRPGSVDFVGGPGEKSADVWGHSGLEDF